MNRNIWPSLRLLICAFLNRSRERQHLRSTAIESLKFSSVLFHQTCEWKTTLKYKDSKVITISKSFTTCLSQVDDVLPAHRWPSVYLTWISLDAINEQTSSCEEVCLLMSSKFIHVGYVDSQRWAGSTSSTGKMELNNKLKNRQTYSEVWLRLRFVFHHE